MSMSFVGPALRRLGLLALGSIALASVLVSCGGDGAGKGGDGPPIDGSSSSTITATYLTLSLLDASSRDVTQSPVVEVGSSLTLEIVATSATGDQLPNTVITITSPSVATLDPATGTALTDSEGVARVTVIGSAPGAGELSASATIGGQPRTETTALMVTAPSGAMRSGLSLSLFDAAAVDVSQSPQVAVGSQLILRIDATDSNGAPVPNTLITITAPTVATMVPESGTVLTDSTGVARLTVVGTTTGAGELLASAIIGGQTITAFAPLMVTPALAAAEPKFALFLFDANGVDVTQAPRVAVGSQLTLRIEATDSKGDSVPNILVTVTAPHVTALVPAVGTVLTDSLGVARIMVEGLAEGAGALAVDGTIDATAKTSSISLAVTAPTTVSQSPTALSVAYISASIQTLKIAAAVGESTSTLTFRVVNQSGQPVPNQSVAFTPSVTTGGLSVSPLVATTLADGTVTTSVTAGAIPTPVRVKATTTLASTGLESSAQSLQLSISSGNPSQRFFSLSAETLNIDGCEFDGAKTRITARAGDQFGNPVPDGTTVNFVTEGGRIGTTSVGSCETANGVCSVDLESQEYRPKGYFDSPYNNCRVSVLAYAVGEETFNDANSNGIYDGGEPFEDLPDAFLNIEPLNRTPVMAASSFLSRSLLAPTELVGDRLIPFQSDGRTAPQIDEVWGQAHVRDWLEVVFSSRHAAETLVSSAISFAGCKSDQTGLTQNASIVLADRNGNAFAEGSSIAVEVVGATAGTLSPASVPNTSSRQGTNHQFVVTFDPSRCVGGTSAGVAGSVRVKVTPVGGVEQVFSLPVSY